MEGNYLHSDLTSRIIGCFYTVYNKLGYGFLEKIYHNALLIELRKLGLICESKAPIEVFYDQIVVGQYAADIIVNDVVILELKAAETICADHETQLVNYLKATNIEVGLLLNFGRAAQFKRRVFNAQYKKS